MCTDGIIAVNLDNQIPLWEIDFRPMDRNMGFQIIPHDGKVYITSTRFFRTSLQETNILEVNPRTGSFNIVHTSVSMSPPVFYVDATTNEISFIVNEFPDADVSPPLSTQNIKRVNIETGDTIWTKTAFTANFASNGLHPPIIYNDIVITGGDWSLYAFDINTGEQLWRTLIPNQTFGSFGIHTNHLIHNDKLYANGAGFEMLYINPNTGNIIWQNNETPRSTDNMFYYQ